MKKKIAVAAVADVAQNIVVAVVLAAAAAPVVGRDQHDYFQIFESDLIFLHLNC